jgi:hypothetical protein
LGDIRKLVLGLGAGAAISLLAIPVLAISSVTYQQAAAKYINTNCKAKVSNLVALRCFLYARTQEFGTSLSGVQSDVSSIRSINNTQDSNIKSVNESLSAMASDTLPTLQANDSTQDDELKALSDEVTKLKAQVGTLSAAAKETRQFRNVISIPVGQPLIATSSCPDGWTLTGGGGYFAANGEQPRGEVVLMTSDPLYDGTVESPNTWRIAGMPIGALVMFTTAEAVAICQKN